MIIDCVIFRSVGDVLMGTPICRAIKEKYPDSKIRFHTEHSYIDLVDGCPYIDDVIAHDVKIPKPGEAFVGDAMSVYNWLRSNPGDHLAMMAMCNGIDMWWYRQPEHYEAKHHMIDFYASRTGLDLKVTNRHIEVAKIEENHPSIARAESLKKAAAGKYIAMHIKSGWKEKDWPVDRFQSIVDWVKREYGFGTIQLGGPKDELLKNVVDGRGKADARAMNAKNDSVDFKTPQQIIRDCEFYMGGDSGLLYIAEGYSKHAFAIMGGTASYDTVLGPDGKEYGTCPAGPQGPNMHYIEPPRPMSQHCRPHTCWSPCKFDHMCVTMTSIGVLQGAIKEYIPNAPVQ